MSDRAKENLILHLQSLTKDLIKLVRENTKEHWKVRREVEERLERFDKQALGPGRELYVEQHLLNERRVRNDRYWDR